MYYEFIKRKEHLSNFHKNGYESLTEIYTDLPKGIWNSELLLIEVCNRYWSSFYIKKIIVNPFVCMQVIEHVNEVAVTQEQIHFSPNKECRKDVTFENQD